MLWQKIIGISTERLAEELHLCESVALGASPPFLNPPSQKNPMDLFVQHSFLVSGKAPHGLLKIPHPAPPGIHFRWCYTLSHGWGGNLSCAGNKNNNLQTADNVAFVNLKKILKFS